MRYKKEKKDKCIRVRIDNRLWRRLDLFCKDIDETKSNFLRALLISYLQKVEDDIRNEGLVYDEVIV